MLTGLLLLGFWTGLRHALEADHVAAVATLATRARSLRELAGVAGAWGLGHGAVLVAAAATLGGLGVRATPALAAGFELAAGVLLVGLGVEVLLRGWRRGVRVTSHRHADGRRHLHAHPAAQRVDHAHRPVAAMLRRALWVGGAHGLAGSAALGLLAAQGVLPGWGVLYAACFGLGAIAGMLALSLSVSLPLGRSARSWGARRRALEWATGLASVGVGLWLSLAALRTLVPLA